MIKQFPKVILVAFLVLTAVAISSCKSSHEVCPAYSQANSPVEHY